MKIVKQMKLYVSQRDSKGDIIEMPMKVSEHPKNVMSELIKNRTKCITIFDSLADYKYSTMGTKYTQINVFDAVGYVDGIDWETGDVILEIDDKYGLPDDPYYISKEDWESYALITRGAFQIIMDTSGSGTTYAQLNTMIGFDLVKV